MTEYYCEECEDFGYDDVCQLCGHEIIEPEWSKQRAIEERDELSEQINIKLI